MMEGGGKGQSPDDILKAVLEKEFPVEATSEEATSIRKLGKKEPPKLSKVEIAILKQIKTYTNNGRKQYDRANKHLREGRSWVKKDEFKAIQSFKNAIVGFMSAKTYFDDALATAQEDNFNEQAADLQKKLKEVETGRQQAEAGLKSLSESNTAQDQKRSRPLAAST